MVIFAAAKHGTDIDIFVSKVLLNEDVGKEQLLNIMRECECLVLQVQVPSSANLKVG